MGIITKNLSKIAFLFIIFVVIAGGEVKHVLSCQMQNLLIKSQLIKHIIGIILIFFFIMLEGGWDFSDKELNKAPNDWSSGNAIHTMIYAFIIYGIFMITSKSRIIPNLIVYLLLFITYLINTQKNYWDARNEITETSKKKLINIEIILLAITGVVAIYGFIDYVFYKKSILGKKFNWFNLLFSTKMCDSI